MIPQELTVLIISKLDRDYSSLKDVSYNLRKLLQDDATYRILLRISNPSFYDFIGTVKNIDGCDTWRNIYEYYMKIFVRFGYCENLYYSYKIYTDFPYIYKYTKDINLIHYGVVPRIYATWKGLYGLLIPHSNLDFIKGKYTLESHYEINNVLLVYSQEMSESVILFSKIVGSIAFINRNCISEPTIKDTIDTLYATFIFNTDMYESLLATIDIGILLENHETKLTFARVEQITDPTRHLRYRMFMDDLESRV